MICVPYTGSVAIETRLNPKYPSLSLLLKRNAFCLKHVYKGKEYCLIELLELPKRH